MYWIKKIGKFKKHHGKDSKTRWEYYDFPEGTWNLSPNEIVYDIQLGTVDIAMETGAVILPVSVEQYEEKKKFVVNSGDIIEIKQRGDKEYKIKKHRN